MRIAQGIHAPAALPASVPAADHGGDASGTGCATAAQRAHGAPRFNAGQRGIANAFGAKGVNAQCEYVITGPALGTGVCLFSDAAKYQLHFGG